MKTCIELNDLPHTVKLEQRDNGSKYCFRVTYGAQTFDNLEYTRAAKELGLCIMHALAIEGKLENKE